MKKVTIDQIARAAGVGTGTVSRVLNQDARVRPSTRESVLAVMHRYGYRPNASARSLARNSSRTLCFMMANRASMHLFNVKTLNGVLACCEAAGFTVLYTHFQYAADRPAAALELPPIVRERGLADGVILVGINHPNFIERLLAIGTPFVVQESGYAGVRSASAPAFDAVSMDDTGGMARATRHLIGLGHRRILFVGDLEMPWFARRYEGYRAAMVEAGLRPDRAWCDGTEPDNFLAGAACAGQLMARRLRHTAIVAGDDLVMLGISTALERHRLAIPGAVSLVGFGDSDEIRYHQNPAFTTIRAPRFEMGTELARSLMARIADPARPPQSVVLPTELVVRESCAPPSA